MTAFRILMAILFTFIVGYTTIVIINHGWNLFPVFFGDIKAMAWTGQFNSDFMGFLILSGLWLAWRHQFKLIGILLGICGLFGGIMFLSIYLFVISFKADGNIQEILLGKNRN